MSYETLRIVSRVKAQQLWLVAKVGSALSMKHPSLVVKRVDVFSILLSSCTVEWTVFIRILTVRDLLRLTVRLDKAFCNACLETLSPDYAQQSAMRGD
jgi:hypothetical protein